MSDAPHHVYFVHGIGKHKKKWIETREGQGARSLRQEIESAWNLYNENDSLGPIGKSLDLVSISYDHVFSALYQQWDAEISELKTHLVAFPGAANKLEPLIRIAEAPANGVAGDDFFYTHGFDLLWYWANSAVQGKIVAEVADQLINDIKKHYDKPGHTFSIVAHSMGTSVIHKVLQALWTQPEYDNRLEHGKSLSSVLKFRLLMQVSNTSYVLSADRGDHYATLVKPSAISNRGVCNTMANVSHQFDLVSEAVPFIPPADEWLDAYSQVDDCYLDIRTRRMTRSDVHSICHYFENPLVHQPFFERILNKRISKKLKQKNMNDFQNRTPSGKFKLLRQQLDVLSERDFNSIPTFLVAVREYIDLIKSFKQ